MSSEFRGEAARGEYYTFQIGVYAARAAIDSGKDYGDIRVGFGDLVSASGGVIPADLFACPSVGGYDRHGQPMARSFKVGLGRVRPLWFGVQVPEDIPPGDYSGTMAIKVFGAPEAVIKLTLTVTQKTLHDAGDSDLWRLSRLWWLDSRIAVDDETVSPYTPIKVNGSELGVLGRSIKFGRTGLPESIKAGGKEILARPIDMLVEESGGAGKIVGSGSPKNLKENSGRVVREYSGSSDVFSMRCLAITDLDGHCDLTVALKAKKDASLKDIRLEIPLKKEAALYMMGLGRKGGYRPSEWKWSWDINRANNSLWIGDVDAGLWLKLKGPRDVVAGDDLKATGIPKSWGNDGKGGCTVTEQADCALIRVFSGARTVKADEEITFRFALMPTPLKPLDESRWNRRYAGEFTPVDKIKLSGANVVNLSCGTEPNPYTNYPFLTTAKLADYIQDAHRIGAKVNLGYNLGELSNHCPELWALRSLGSEVISDGPGGGEPWLQEHLIASYKPGRAHRVSDSVTDAPLALDGLSRWANYYIEGLAWLIENARVDGLYLDGVGFDREVMKRARKVMDAAVGVQFGASNRPSEDKGYVPPEGKGEANGETGVRLIDLHSEADPNDLGPGICPACRWMDLLPYINSFRFDGMRADEQHDYWLVEVSGLPFGVVGDVPKGMANPWKGMLYGMATRAGSDEDPSPVWKLWDGFGIKDSKMIGYWSKACPVKTGNENVLATVYAKKGKALIALVNWAREPARVKLTVDWKALGLDIRKADLKAVEIPGVQSAEDFQWSGEIPVEPGKGWLLVLQEK